MAGEATIGALRVVLGADTAKFEDNLRSALDSLNGFGKKALQIAGGIGIEQAFEKTFHAVVDSIEQAIESADKLAKASEKFGVPTDTLQVLANAAALSDVSLQELGQSLSRLSKNMVAAQNPTSDQAAAFNALGISVKDASGQLKSGDAILREIADSFSKFQDGTTKTALAVALFGRAGADLIPVLDQGSRGLDEYRQRMEGLGQIVDNETIKAAEALKDTLTELGKTKDALILKILGDSGLLAAMNKLASSFVETAGDAEKFQSNFGGLVQFIQNTQHEFELIGQAIDYLKSQIPPLGSEFDKLAESVDKVGKNIGFDKLLAGVDKLAASMTKAPVFDPEAAKKLKAFNDELNKMSMAGLDAAGIFADKLAPGFLALTANMDALKGQIKLTGDGMVQLGPQAEQLNQALLQLRGQQIINETLPAWQQFQAQIESNTTALQALGLNADQIAAINERAALRAGVSWQNASADILHNAAAGFAAFAAKNKEFAGIAKGLAIAEATFNTYQAATKALATYPPPFGEIAAAAAVVAGLGMVAKITATSFAKGGSFKVPGGMSGVDNQLVPLALAPGERVDVTPAGQARDRGGGYRVIELAGIGPRDLFTGTMLRDLVEALNQGDRDGYRLKFSER